MLSRRASASASSASTAMMNRVWSCSAASLRSRAPRAHPSSSQAARAISTATSRPSHGSCLRTGSSSGCPALLRTVHTRSALAGKEDDPEGQHARPIDESLRTIFAQPTQRQPNSRTTKFTMTFAPKKPGQVLGDPTAPDPKFAARKQKKLEKKKRQADPNYRKPFVFTGFPVPTRPERIEMGDKLAAQIDALRERPDIVPRLRNYGISARTAWLVLERLEALPGTFTTHRKKTLTDNEIIAHLYWTWAQKAKGYIRAKVRQKTLTPGVPYGRRFKPGAIAEPPNGEYFTADIDAIRDSYAIEEDACLPRTCMSAFIDWVEVHVRDISASDSAAAVDREVLRATLSQLSLLRKSTDLRLPTYNYPLARTLTRQIHLHIGPTNSGKTHGALVALSKARTGVFAGPLRLLAHEVWERFNQGTISPGVPPRACNLVTGEEQRTVDPLAGLYSCTVEMVNLQRAWDVAVIDEIQMIGDRQRGYAWTDAVIGLPAKEIHLCGEASTVPLIRRIAEACGDEVYVHEYQRLTPLSIADESLDGDLTKVQKGDCVVAFSRSGIFNLKREIEQKTKLRCAVAYGALPPETKSEQAKLFNEGKLDVMVASDAIGMGLNLKIKRVIFDTLTKWNGKETVAMSTSQIKQIAGRAGRYGTKRESDEPDGGIVTTRNANELEMLREALAAPVVPIEQAAIQPSSDAMADLSALLPASATPTPAERVVDVTEDASEASSSAAAGEPAQTEFRPLDKIYGDVSLLARVDPKSFFLSDFSQQRSISPLVEAASSNLLTLQEREKFGNAPANTRDERLMAFLASCVRLFSRGNLVKFDACSADLGTLEVEKLTLDAMGEARRHRGDKLKGAKSAEERRMIEAEPLASHLASDHPLLNSNTLMLLESLHRSLSLYLWLSYRFPLAFCYRQEVEERKTKMEDGIEFCLEGIRFGRARRLRALGRDADADEALQKKSWKETKRDERRSLEDAEQGLRGGQASRWERDEYGSEGGERNGPRRSKYEDQVRREDGQSQRSERPRRPERW